MEDPASRPLTAELLGEQIGALQDQLRARMLAIEADRLRVRALQADLGVKDGYIAMLEQRIDANREQMLHANRDAAPVRLIRRVLGRTPRLLRAVHPLTRRLANVISPATRPPRR